jgi:hypothetical protein
MPKFKQVKSLVTLSTNVSASLVHKSALFLDSISWPASQFKLPEQVIREGAGGSTPSPNLSPLNPHHAAVILSPSVESFELQTSSMPVSAFSQNYVDYCKQLRSWLMQMPIQLLELVVSKVTVRWHVRFQMAFMHALDQLAVENAPDSFWYIFHWQIQAYRVQKRSIWHSYSWYDLGVWMVILIWFKLCSGATCPFHNSICMFQRGKKS